MNDHIAKPVDPKVLYATLARWLPANDTQAMVGHAQPDSVGLDVDTRPAEQTLDTEQGLKYFAGNQVLYEKMLGKFLELHHDDVRVLNTLLDEDRIDDAERLAHTLKSIAATIGAHALQARVVELESKLHDRIIKDQLLDDVESFALTLSAVCEAIEALGVKPETEASAGSAIDLSALKTTISELESQLAQNLIEASATWRTLQPEFAKVMSSDRIATLSQQIDHFDFPDALETLRVLMAEYF